jgi:NTE family protein
MNRLFVRSGGGMPGLDIHVGYWLALEEAGIVADECRGTSAGAIMSAFDASGVTAKETKEIINNLEDRDVRDERFMWKLRVATGINWFLDNKLIRALLKDYVAGYTAEYEKECTVCAMRWSDLEPVYFNNMDYDDDFRECVIASMSIAGVFPRIKINNVEYSDGGTRDNVPVPLDLRMYDEVYVLIATGIPQGYKGRDTILTSLLRQSDALMYDQPCDIVEEYRDNPKVKILWMRTETPKGSLHFDHNLIDKAYQYAKQEIRR